MEARTNAVLAILLSAACGSCSGQAPAQVQGNISVAVTPPTLAVPANGSAGFTAAVSGAAAGQSTAVTWSVQEGPGGGSVSATGAYTAPGTPGTFHVVATSVVDSSKAGSATVSVGTAGPSVSISPGVATIAPGAAQTFSATVAGSSNGAVVWSVQEGAAGGSVDAAGHYTAPTAAGTYHLIATSAADSTAAAVATVYVNTFTLVPGDRLTVWNPGIPGGVPSRTTVCATVDAAKFNNGSVDATAAIQSALDACPAGQVVQLSAGAFRITGTLQITKGVVLRGQGSTQTRLMMPVGTNASVITIGTQFGPKYATSVNLAADAPKGSTSVTLAS